MEEAQHQLGELFDKARALGGAEEIVAERIVSVPIGRTLQSLKKLQDEYADKPDRRVGTDVLLDLASLGDWINRHKDAGTVVFCDTDRKKPKMLAVIDYHLEGEGDDKARFAKFRGLYEFPLDQRWIDWSAVDGTAMNQAEFAAFLEDHILDLQAPDVSIDGDGNTIAPAPDMVSRFLALAGGGVATPGEVVALSRGLDLTVDAKVANRVNLQSGERNLVFEEVHGNGNGEKVKVPQLFLIAIPVFDRSHTVYKVPVRLRYRIDMGKVIWFPTLFGAKDIFDRAIFDAATDLVTATSVPVFLGKTGA